MNEPNFNGEEGEGSPNIYEPPSEGFSPLSEKQLEDLTKQYQALYQENTSAETPPQGSDGGGVFIEAGTQDPSATVGGEEATYAFMEHSPDAVEGAVDAATGDTGLEKVQPAEMPVLEFGESEKADEATLATVPETGTPETPASVEVSPSDSNTEAAATATGPEITSEGTASPVIEAQSEAAPGVAEGVASTRTESGVPFPGISAEYNPGFFARYREKLQRKIEGLPDATRRFAEGLFATAKFNTIDRLRISVNQKLLDWHDGFADKYASQVRSYDAEIASIKNIGSSEIAHKYGLTSLPGFEQARARQQQGNMRRIEELEHKREVAQNKLKRRNNKKATYENARDDIARGYEGKVQEQLKPIEVRMEQLRSEKNQFDTEIEALVEKQDQYLERITSMEKDLSNGKFYQHERELVKTLLKDARSEHKLTSAMIQERLRARVKVEKRMVPVEGRMDKWRERKNVAARITNRDTNYQEVGERRRVDFDAERVDLSIEDPTPREASGEGSAAESAEVLTVKNFEQRWNTYFKSSLPIRTEALEQVVTAGGYKEDATLTPELIGKLVNEYADALRTSGHRDAHRFTPKDVARALKAFASFNRS